MARPVITLSPANDSNPRREASFSSYLNLNEENFVHTLSGRKKTEDKEIDVFDAHKYFNEGTTNQTCKIVKKDLLPFADQSKKDDPFEVLPAKTRRWTSSPSMRSESSCKSSCNSRSRLMMHGVPRNQQPAGKRNISFLDIISCSCVGKEHSNDIHDYALENWKSGSEEKSRDWGLKKSESDEPGYHFSFPVFGERKSLQVLSTSPDNRIRGIERKFNMFAWNSVSSPGRVAIKIPRPVSRGIDFCDSDACSGVFDQVESMPGNCFYAPSEASVEWSVITDTDDDVKSDTRKIGKNGSSFLSGCKNQKAVNVHKPNAKASNVAPGIRLLT